MSDRPVQDFYPDDIAYCYGCGRLNEHGLHLKSYWNGEEAVCVFEPRDYHTVAPGYVYGGLIASIIDCHGCGTAAAAGYQREGRPLETDPPLRYVTAALHVDYLKPTPIGVALELRGRATEVGERKIVVDVVLSANGEITARGNLVTVRMPDDLFDR